MKKLYAFELSSHNDLLAVVKQALHEALLELPSSNFNSDEPPDDFEVLSSKDVCNLLGISMPTLTKYRRRGKLKAKKVGRKYHYLKSDLNNFLKK